MEKRIQYLKKLAVLEVDESPGQLQQHEENLSSFIISAVEKLVQQHRDPHLVWTSISTIRSKLSSAQKRGYTPHCDLTRVITERR